MMNSFAKWTVSMLVTAFVTMLFIVLIKSISRKVQIPVVSSILEEV